MHHKQSAKEDTQRFYREHTRLVKAGFAALALFAFLGLVYTLNFFMYAPALRWVEDYQPAHHRADNNILPGHFGDALAYDMGINAYGGLVFQNPDAAFRQFSKDYADAIRLVQADAKLRSFSIRTTLAYRSYGESLLKKGIQDEPAAARLQKLLDFLDVYEGSIDRSNLLFILFHTDH